MTSEQNAQTNIRIDCTDIIMFEERINSSKPINKLNQCLENQFVNYPIILNDTGNE